MTDENQDAGANAVSKAADKARLLVEETSERARNLVKETKARTEEVAGAARDGAYRAADTANSLLTEHPMVATAAAAAAGAVIGMLLPRWRLGFKMGSAVGTATRSAVKVIAIADTAKMLMSGLASAGGTVRTGAQRLAEQAPDVKTVKSGAARALALASEAVQIAGQKVAQKARRVAKTREVAEKAKPPRKTRSKRATGED